MNIAYYHNLPAFMDGGGGGTVIREITSRLRKNHTVTLLDTSAQDITFDVCIVFGFTYMNFEIFRYLRSKGVRVIVYPIFDRLTPLWQMQLCKPVMMRLPIHNSYRERRDLLRNADCIVVANQSEKRDICSLYDADESRITCMHYCLSDVFLSRADTIDESLFLNKYPEWKGCVFCPASRIYPRKNQKLLLEAIKDTSIKLVLNNTDIIDGYERQEIEELLALPHVLALGRMSEEEMISCYKAASVVVSVSHAETAGLINLEALYCGCNVAVSNLESLHEYLGDYALYMNQHSIDDIRSTLQLALTQTPHEDAQKYIKEHFTWDVYIDNVEKLLHTTY